MTAVPLPRSMEVLEDEKRLSFFPVKDITKNLAKEFETPRVKNMISRLSQDVYINGSEYMKVYVRVRPFSADEIKLNEDQKCIELAEDGHALTLHPPKESCKFRASSRGSGETTQTYSFTKVFPPVTGQKEFFDATTLKVVDDFISGHNSLIFTYGVTSSGKTFTMQGEPGNEGIMPRSIDVIFNSIGDHVAKDSNLHLRMANDVTVIGEDQKCKLARRKQEVLALADASDQVETHCGNKDSLDQVSVASTSSLYGEMSTTMSDNNSTMDDTKRTSKRSSFLEFVQNKADDSFVDVSSLGPVKFVIFVSFIEIYKEYIYDLLRPMPKGKNARRPALRLGEHRGLPFVKDLSEIQIHSREEMYKLLTIGQNHLHMAETNLNHNSSRSHCIFSIKIVCTKDLDKPSTVRVSQLSFCDLAGSERWGKTSSFGERLKEAGKINTSMLTLGKCIEALRYNQQHRNRNPKVVPYRESRLTRLFQSILQGHGRACMVVNVNQRASMFDETAHALKFSAIASEITVADKPSRKSRASRASSRSSSNEPASPAKQKRVTIGWEPAQTPIKEQDEDADSEESGDKATRPGDIKPPDDESSDEEEDYTYDDWKEREARLLKAIEILRQALREEKESNLLTERNVREECMEEMKNHFVSCKEDYEERLERAENQGEQKYESSVALANRIITRVHNEKLALEKDNEKLDEECEELENKLDVATEEIKDLKTKMAILNEQLKEMKEGENGENGKETAPSNLEDQSDMFRSLQKEYEDGREIIQEQIAVIKTISEALEEKTDENEKLIIEQSSYKDMLTKVEEKNASLTAQIDEMTAESTTLSKKLANASEEATEKESALQQKIIELNSERSSYKDILEKVEEKNASLTAQIDKMTAESTTLSKKLVNASEEGSEKESALQQNIIELNSKCACLQSDIAERESNVDKLTAELQKCNEDIDQLRVELVASNSKAQLHEQNLKSTEAELTAVTSKLEESNEMIKQEQSNSMRSRDELLTTQNQLEAANRNLEKSESNASAALKKVAQDEDAAEKERKLMEEEISNLKAERDMLTSKADELTITLEEAILCGEMKTAEVEKLKEKITEMETEENELKKCIDEIKKEREDTKVILGKEQEARADIEQKLSEKEKQIEKMSYDNSLEEVNSQKKHHKEIKVLEQTHEKSIKDLKKAHTKEILSLESNLRSLNDELEESRKESVIASTLEKQLMTEIDRLQSQANKLESDKTTKEQNLKRESQASDLAQDVNILTHERDDLLKTVEKLTQDLSKVSKEKQELEANQRAVEMSVAEASELEKLKDTLKEMDKLQEAQHHAIEKYEETQKENENEVISLKKVIESTREENEKKSSELSNAMAGRDKAEVERSNLAQAMTSLERDVAKLKEELKEKSKETQIVAKQVEEKDTEIKLLQNKVESAIDSKEKELKKFREARDRISSALEGKINSQQACSDALKVKLETQIEANVKLRSENSALKAQLQLIPKQPIPSDEASVVPTTIKQEFTTENIPTSKTEEPSSAKTSTPEQTPTNSPVKAAVMVNTSTGMVGSPLPVIKQEDKAHDSNDENTPPSENSQHSDDDNRRQTRGGRSRRATRSISRQPVVKKASSRRKRGGAALRPATPIPEDTQSNDSSPPVRRRRTTRATSSNEVIVKSETSSAVETDDNDATLINQVLDGSDLVRATGNSQQFPKSEMEIDVTPQLKKTRRGKRTNKNNEATESSVDPPSLSKTRSRRRGKPAGLEAAISIDEEGKSKVNVARMGNILKNSPVGQAFRRIEAAISPSRSPIAISGPTALTYNDPQRHSTRRVRKLHADDISLPLQSTPEEHSVVGSISGRVGLLSQTQNVVSETTRKLRRRK